MRIKLKNYIHILGILLVFWVLGVLLLSQIYKGEAIIYFTQHRSSFYNVFFGSITQLAEFPVYAIVFALVWVSGRKEKAKAIMYAGLITIVVSFCLKTIFAQPRPLRYFEQKHIVVKELVINGLDVHSGFTSYPSGHSMGAFSLFVIIALLWADKKIFGISCILLAIAVGISRIYLAQHFLNDVMAGSMVGSYIACVAYFLIYKKKLKKKTKTNIA